MKTRPLLPALSALIFLLAFALRLAADDGAFVPPKAEEIASYGSFPMALVNTSTLYLTVDKEKIMEFLAKGTVEKNEDHLRGLMFLGLPDDIIKSRITGELDTVLHKYPNNSRSAPYFNVFMLAEGAVVTKDGKSFYWRLWNERVLELYDESGKSCMLELGQDAAPSAQFIHTYWCSADGKVADTDGAGKLPPPKPGDIATFSNRPQPGYGLFELCFPFSQNRIAKFLKDGTPDAEFAAHKPERTRALLLRPEKIPENVQHLIAGWRINPMDGLSGSGVMTIHDGTMIYWKLLNDVVLFLEDSGHRTCVLRLGKGDDSVVQNVVDGNLFESAVPAAATFAGPKWTPGDVPPVDEEKAAEIAFGELAKMTADTSGWRVAEIQSLPLNGTGYYKVTLTEPVDPGDTSLLQGKMAPSPLGNAVIFVTIDGKPTETQKRLDAKDAE